MSYSRNTRPIRVSPMLSVDNVAWALRQQMRPPPEYVKAVIRSYVDVKFARGKTRYEVDMKLIPLEQEYPQHADQFRAVRQDTGLPISRVLPSSRADELLRRTVTTTPSSSSTRRPSGITRVTTSPSTPRASRQSSGVVRPTPTPLGDDEELPPPPYQRTDPEPDQTRLLEERLAAEALTAGTLAADPHPNPPTPSPPVTTSQAARSPRPPSPQPMPSDPDLQRVWEESQFDEAKRESLAAEREREEMEKAIQLSLAEAEGSGFGNQAAPGPSTAPPIQTSFQASRPSSKASEGYGGAEMGHRRTVSDAGVFDRPSVDRLTSGMANMPGGWGNGLGAPPAPTGANASANTSLLDDDEALGVNGPPMLTPNKTGAVLQSKNPFLSMAEREQIQAEENIASQPSTPQQYPISAQPTTPPPPATPTPNQSSSTPSHLSPPPPPRQPSTSSSRDSPGSSRTQYTPVLNQSPRVSKPLPTPPGPGGIHPVSASPSQYPLSQSPQYAPPAGQPTPQLVVQTDSQSPPLPPRRDTSQTQRGVGYYPSDSFFSPTGAQPQSFNITSPTAELNQAPSLNTELQSLQHATGQYDQTNQFNSQFESAIPPGQSPAAPPQATAPNLPVRRVSTLQNGEDPLELLKEYDTVFLIDDSASMAGERWEQAKNAVIGVAEIAAGFDDDGIDVYFLNSKRVGHELKASMDVEDLFAGLTPKGPTPTGARMETILRDYLSRLERSGMTSPMAESPTTASENRVKPLNLVIITDGAPSDDPESVIISAARRLDRGDHPLTQIGIQFFQIGNDPDAREALQELDDGLSSTHGIRDMVDTVPYTGEEMSASLLIKTLLGGINRRLDQRGRR